MIKVRYIVPFILSVLLLGGCRSSSALKKQKEQEQERTRLIYELISPPPVEELTSSLSINLNGAKVNGQLRMRRGRSIQVSASLLGLMEVARVEFLPEMVVVMDRVHNLYSVCHYADIPYRNELGLDFEVVQSFLWNRIFSPGSSGEADAASRLEVREPDEKGNVSISDVEYGYLFVTDGKERLDTVIKRGGGYSFRLDYSDFTVISGKWRYPMVLSSEIILSGDKTDLSVRLSSVSTDRKNWKDRSAVPRRMKQVSLDELLDNLDL